MNTQKNRQADHHTNQFGDFPTAHITAHFLNGQVIDVETKNPVMLKDGALMHLKVYRKNILDKDIDKFKTERKTVLKAGTELSFILPYDIPSNYNDYRVSVRLLEDLVFEKKSGKLAVALPCSCEVYDMVHSSGRDISGEHSFKPFIVDSLNQAFFQTSVKYRPNNKSHSCNIYKSIRIHPSGKLLDDLRF